MPKITAEQLNRHVKTHTKPAGDDRSAVSFLESFLSSDGKINCDFSRNDKWPNTDGFFELVPDPGASRKPRQNFVVQIKGTNHPRFSSGGVLKYQLQTLSFPAYVAAEVTLDPSILFVVLNPGKRGQRRVFWKYISPQFIASIDFGRDSATIDFTPDDEIEDTDAAIDTFVKKLDRIADTHSYIRQLESRYYTEEDVVKVITARCENISDAIETGAVLDYTRDKLSRKILTELEDLCKGTLLLNGLRYYSSVNLPIAWELALTGIDTKFLASFLQGLRYIGLRVPEEGQYERLMLKYYGFLWRIRKYLKEVHALPVLDNLEKFPRETSDEDEEYNRLLAAAVEAVGGAKAPMGSNRYYVQKKVPFYAGAERYFEITLQLADMYATKYHRLTAYSKLDISSNYSVQIGCAETEIPLWDHPSKIKVITGWRVSVEPAALNKLSKILRRHTALSSNYSEYGALMDFLTRTGISLLDFIDMRDERFYQLLTQIYQRANTAFFKEVLAELHRTFHFQKTPPVFGRNTVRYALIRLREDLLGDLLPEDPDEALNSSVVYLSKKCYPFERDPVLYNLPRKKTNGNTISRDVLRAVGTKNMGAYLPYIRMKHLINTTGELYHPREALEYPGARQTVGAYNDRLTRRDRENGCALKEENGLVYLDEYVKNTLFILRALLDFSADGNGGQEQLNENFVADMDTAAVDRAKISALQTVFVHSKVIMIYGAAGTGKTTLMNYISNLMDGRSKLFLTKTHTALENLQRRIKSPGFSSAFMGIDKFTKSGVCCDYDVIFLDECSTIDNRTMVELLKKIPGDSLLVFAGDIYQIESIDFGNWFFYAKEILPEKSVVELGSTWRTQEENIKRLWEAVRFIQPLITEMLVIDGPFSENIGKSIFRRDDDDEVVLCLNYDGKFGLNSINSYFQDANPSEEAFYWSEWKYKVGDPILFNENRRFPMLYNNLKGKIVDIERDSGSICFTIDIPIPLTAVDLRGSELERVSTADNSTRIRFRVYANDEGNPEGDQEEARMRSIVPFQLAYAVSIHKAQGLEYNSIKVVIPGSNSEKISHGIFYTAITRTKEKLKIFWSSDTMHQIISSFQSETANTASLDIIKVRLKKDQAPGKAPL